MNVRKSFVTYTQLMKLNKMQVLSLNLASLQKESFMALCISIVMLVVSFFFTSELWEAYRFHLVIFLSASLSVNMLCVFDRGKMLPVSTIVAFTYSCFLLFYFSVFHFFSIAIIPEICFYSLLILMPIIFFTNPLIMYPILGSFTLFYIMLAYISEDPKFLITVINTVTVFFCSFILSIQLQKTKLHTIETGRIIEEQRDTDQLTGLPNRTKLMNELERSVLEEDSNTILGVFMVDVDFFKKFNDSYGHYQGDKCLKSIGSCLSSFGLRNGMEFFRYGGEEFIAIIRKRNSKGRLNKNAESFSYDEVAQNLLNAVHNLQIPCRSGIDPFVTISAGYSIQDTGVHLSIEELISRADWALYQSKSKGRNRASSWQETPESLSQIKEPEHVFKKETNTNYHPTLKAKEKEYKKINSYFKANKELVVTTNIRLMVIIFSVLSIVGGSLSIISYTSSNTAWEPYQ